MEKQRYRMRGDVRGEGEGWKGIERERERT